MEIATDVMFGNKTFACHKTLDYTHVDDDNEDGWDGSPSDTPHTQHCAGALIMCEKSRPGHNQMLRIAERLGLYDPSKLDMESDVYDSVEAMAEGHAGRGRK